MFGKLDPTMVEWRQFEEIAYRAMTPKAQQLFEQGLEGSVSGQAQPGVYAGSSPEALAEFLKQRQEELPEDTVLLGPRGSMTAKAWIAQRQVEGQGIVNIMLPMGDLPPYVFLMPTKDIDLVARVQVVAPESIVYSEPPGWIRGLRTYVEFKPNYVLALGAFMMVGAVVLVAFWPTGE